MSTVGPYRLSEGGQIDRSRRISFTFDGRAYHGHPGDTLASALLASGVRVCARSFKFHRPRGIFSCGMEEPNALVQLGEGARVLPSCRAPTIELHEGLDCRAQEGWPSLNFDVGRVLDFTARLWSAGFYNKTFIWPSWHTYEGLIRRLAGLGRAPRDRDPDRYAVVNHHCDTLVIGGGRSGICAALDAARAGARVVLVEQDFSLGGRVAWDEATIGDKKAADWLSATAAELAGLTAAKVLTRTTAVASFDHNVFALLERLPVASHRLPRERLWIVRAERLVLATGTIEQPLIFDHNDRPGILLAGSARQYLKRYGVAAGSNVLIATNNDSAYQLAEELSKASVRVVAVTDSRRESEVPPSLRSELRRSGIRFFPRSIPVDTQGFSALKGVRVGRLATDSRGVEAYQTFRCDALAVSGGFAPALQLFAQAGGKLHYDETSGSLRPSAAHPSIQIVGSAAGVVPIGPRVSPVGNTRRQWVDLLHDVTVADLELALRENYTSVEHVKRYTTVGMAPDQGKTATAAALGVLGKLRGVSSTELGYTTFRPPVTPVTLGAIAGREIGEQFAPRRQLPMHDWHLTHGAVMQDFGAWQRAVAYVREGETREQAMLREARAVRTAAGLFDGSSLGKIEIRGPDALEFLDRFYINNLKTLKPGRVRYGLMLRETGILFDDGTVVALAPDHLLLTTTSGNAGRVYQWLEEWHQCEWPNLRVAITPVTEQWATVSLAGPRARRILSKFDCDIDLSNAAFRHLSMREGRLLGLPARIYRVSFTGELTYEINVPADSASRLWATLLADGAPEGLQPFGMDALTLMRLEKGFLHIGSDTDGTTVPDDVGWGKVAAAKAADFIGKRSLTLPEHMRSDRLQLAGLVMTSAPWRESDERPATDLTRVDAAWYGGAVRAPGGTALKHPPERQAAAPDVRPFIIGSHLKLHDSTNATDGWITSAGVATTTGEPIALAMLRGGRERVGAEVTVFDAGKPIARAKVMNPPFYDPPGDRMNA
jgi:sarcosine oxidase subunit alpha